MPHVDSTSSHTAGQQSVRVRTPTPLPTVIAVDDGTFRHVLGQVDQRLASVDEHLRQLEEDIAALREAAESQVVVKELYTVAEVAAITDRRPFTVREWCRHGRVVAQRAPAGRGIDAEWRISHQELVRYQNEGLLPLTRPR